MEIVELFRQDIRSGAFNVAAIAADRSGCDWAYSIGLQPCYSHPELLIVGLDAPIAGAILEVLGDEIANGRRLQVGEAVVVADAFTLEVCEVDPLWLSRGDWFNLGREVMLGWGANWVSTMQLLWADGSGRYPQTPGDPEWSFRQPLLASGPRGRTTSR